MLRCGHRIRAIAGRSEERLKEFANKFGICIYHTWSQADRVLEDDEVDVQGLKRAFAKARIGNPIPVARDGIEALEFLRGENGKDKLPS